MSKDDYARAIIGEGKRRGVSPKGCVIAVAVALVETNLIMYANRNDPESLKYAYEKLSTDKNSSGLFQQRPEWWGTAADRMDPARSAGMFFEQLVKLDYNSPAHSPGWYAQQVQKSAYPSRYDERMGEAQQIYDGLNGSVETVADKPACTELDYMGGGGRSNRSRPPVNFLLHTEEGNSSAVDLAVYCNGSHDVSYHYTVRDGILCDVVDTDYASWSVLDANAYTLNICFAGSRSAWSRAEWLKRERDIEIAAYIAVQDCRKYNIPLTVIKPPYVKGPGISDHRYVTDALGIGNHTDVGPNFPWDVFENYVIKWANGGKVVNPKMDTDKRLARIERLLFAAVDQLGGALVAEKVANGEVANFNGFKQGGNRSLYDLASATAAKVAVPGARDVRVK